MSTRTRIILRFYDGSFQYGGAAVKALIGQALPNGFMGAQLPPVWGKMTKREKLQWLSKDLKYGVSLELYQEPRETRKKCSMYWQNKVKKRPVVAKPPEQGIPQPVIHWGGPQVQQRVDQPEEWARRARAEQRRQRWVLDDGF